MTWIPIDKDPIHVAKEKAKARELRKSPWWKQVLAKGLCHYCQNKFKAADLTMDHVVPIARGGKSTKGNVVAACKDCNNKKKFMTPAEMLLEKMGAENSSPSKTNDDDDEEEGSDE